MYTEDGDALLGPRNLQLHAVIPGQYRGVPLAGAATSIIFVAIKRFVATNMCLSRQNTSFITTKVCLSRQNFCRDKIMFVATITCLSRQKYTCRDKHVFVVTKVLS